MVKKDSILFGISTAAVSLLAVAAVASGVVQGAAERDSHNSSKEIHSSNVYARVSEPNNITELYIGESSAAVTQPNANSELTYPIYYYSKDNYDVVYSTEIQKEIYKQWSEFDGELPDYEMVLALWIAESGLNPEAKHLNSDGTTDYGIPQANTLSIETAYYKGWLSKDDNLDDYKVQIKLGLQLLNYCCEECPGGINPYYRAIRAYAIGVNGVKAKEAAGDYGSNDPWLEGPDDKWYPGQYGRVMNVVKYLVKK